MRALKRLSGMLSAVAVAALLPINPSQAATYFYHTDHLGTPQALTDKNQQVVWQSEQEPFGEVTATTNVVEQNLRFPGQYYDVETGLHYNYFRDYDAGIGRYVQSDPIGLLGGANTYGYASGNPIKKTDFYGLFDVISNYITRPDWASDVIARKAFIQSPIGQAEQRLRQLGAQLQEMINNCAGDTSEIQRYYDTWVVDVDSGFNSLRRYANYAVTDYHSSGSSTTFNRPAFSSGVSTFQIFFHEFRHTMAANQALFSGANDYIGGQITGSKLGPYETDANTWYGRFRNGDCSCR